MCLPTHVPVSAPQIGQCCIVDEYRISYESTQSTKNVYVLIPDPQMGPSQTQLGHTLHFTSTREIPLEPHLPSLEVTLTRDGAFSVLATSARGGRSGKTSTPGERVDTCRGLALRRIGFPRVTFVWCLSSICGKLYCNPTRALLARST